MSLVVEIPTFSCYHRSCAEMANNNRTLVIIFFKTNQVHQQQAVASLQKYALLANIELPSSQPPPTLLQSDRLSSQVTCLGGGLDHK